MCVDDGREKICYENFSSALFSVSSATHSVPADAGPDAYNLAAAVMVLWDFIMGFDLGIFFFVGLCWNSDGERGVLFSSLVAGSVCFEGVGFSGCRKGKGRGEKNK